MVTLTLYADPTTYMLDSLHADPTRLTGHEAEREILMERDLGGRFEVDLGVPDLAYLLDHVVVGRSIMPGAAMFEAGLAAAQSLLPDAPPAAEQSDGGEHGLAAAVIPQAVLLKAAGGRLLQCTVTAPTGAVELGGQSGACGCLQHRFIGTAKL